MTQRQSERHETVHRAVRVLVVVWLAVMLVAAPAAAQTETATPTGETAPCDTGPPVPGQGPSNDSDAGGDETGETEIMLTIDGSGSMLSGDRLPDAKTAATGFVNRLTAPDEVGFVEMDSSPTLDSGLTTDYQSVVDAVESMSATEGERSDIAESIETARVELVDGDNADDDANKAMIILTDAEDDGGFDEQAAIDAADDAKADGITIFAVGVGDQVDDQFINSMASSPDDAYIAPDSSDLDAIYQEMSGEIDTGPVSGDLEIDTRSLYQPGATHEYSVNEITYLSNNRTTVTDVTANATVTTTNSTLLSVNEANNTLSATDNANTSTWVRVDATANGSTGCTNVIVAQPTVENLQLVPGIWRFFAVFDDATMFTLLIAALLSVPAARFTSAFGGLAVAEMVIVIGWVAGYIGFGFAAVSVFVALFIGLNLAANIDYQVRA